MVWRAIDEKVAFTLEDQHELFVYVPVWPGSMAGGDLRQRGSQVLSLICQNAHLLPHVRPHTVIPILHICCKTHIHTPHMKSLSLHHAG